MSIKPKPEHDARFVPELAAAMKDNAAAYARFSRPTKDHP